jgi:hypothetical protein
VQHTDALGVAAAAVAAAAVAAATDVPGAGPQPQQRHKVRKLGQRTSSADWSQDRLTWQEEINYKKQCGYL